MKEIRRFRGESQGSGTGGVRVGSADPKSPLPKESRVLRWSDASGFRSRTDDTLRVQVRTTRGLLPRKWHQRLNALLDLQPTAELSQEGQLSRVREIAALIAEAVREGALSRAKGEKFAKELRSSVYFGLQTSKPIEVTYTEFTQIFVDAGLIEGLIEVDVGESKNTSYSENDPPVVAVDASASRQMGDDLNKQEGVGARLLRELSPSQLVAVIEDSTLGRLRTRFENRLREIDLPANGFTTKEQADAVQRLSSTFYQLQDVEAGFGLPLREKPAELREGERLRAEYMRHHDKEGRPIAVRRPGRPRRDVEIVAPKHIL
jgi:hypothetical protein